MPSFVYVEPFDTGWAVRSPLAENQMIFATGARAEHAARDLADRLAAAGEPVVLEIRLRNGERGGRFLFPPHAVDSVSPRVAKRA